MTKREQQQRDYQIEVGMAQLRYVREEDHGKLAARLHADPLFAEFANELMIDRALDFIEARRFAMEVYA